MAVVQTVLVLAVLIMGLAAGACSPAAGPTPTPTSAPVKHAGPLPLAPEGTALRRVQDAGKVVIGVNHDIPTFGYMNPRTREMEGFDVDLGKAVAKHIFDDASKAEFVEAKSADRIPFLELGTVDLIISTMTITEERARQIDFSNVYFTAGQSLLVKTGSSIQSVANLSGRTVGTVQGTTSEVNIRKEAPASGIVLFDTFAEAMAGLDAGIVEAVTTDDIVLLGYVKQAPRKYTVVGGQFTKEPYGVGVAKNNPELLRAVNDAIYFLKNSPEWTEMFDRNLGAGWQAIYSK